jgi:transposase-like protein
MQLSVQEYADLIGKSKMTVYRWIKTKKLPIGIKAEMCCGVTVIKKSGLIVMCPECGSDNVVPFVEGSSDYSCNSCETEFSIN